MNSNYFMGDDRTVLTQIMREQMRDDIKKLLCQYRRPMMFTELARELRQPTSRVVHTVEKYTPMTFRTIASLTNRSDKVWRERATYVGLHDHLAAHEPSYNPFGHLNLVKDGDIITEK